MSKQVAIINTDDPRNDTNFVSSDEALNTLNNADAGKYMIVEYKGDSETVTNGNQYLKDNKRRW